MRIIKRIFQSKFVMKVKHFLTLGNRSRILAPILIVVIVSGLGTYLITGTRAQDAWTGQWESLSGVITAAPAATSWGPNNLQIFVRATDNSIEEKTYTGSWSGYSSLGGATYFAPAVASEGPGNTNVFVVGTDYQVYQNGWTGSGWTGWVALGGRSYSAPTAAYDGGGHLDLFVRGVDNQIYERSFVGGSWIPWFATGMYTVDAPAAVSLGPNNMNVFFRGPDNGVYQMAWTGSGWIEAAMGGTTYSAPSAAVVPGGLDIFARGVDNKVYYRGYNSAGWGAWQSMGGNTPYSPAAVSWGSDRIDVFAAGTDGGLWHTDYAPITNSIGSSLAIGNSIYSGQSLYSPSYTYQAIMQHDGNFVVYRTSDFTPVWSTNTVGSSANVVNYQTDGNLVVRPGGGPAAWAAGTNTYGGTSLRMQDDGNLVLYNSAGHPVWSWETGKIKPPPTPPPAPTVALSALIPTTGVASDVYLTGSTIIPYGKQPLLRYSSTNATACNINGNQVTINGSIYEPAPYNTTNYVFTCSGPGGTASATFKVIVSTNSVKGAPSSDEAVQLSDLNALRSSLRLHTMVDTTCLNQAAQAWSQHMGTSGLDGNGASIGFAHSSFPPAQGGIGNDISLNYCNVGKNGYAVAENIAWRNGCNNLLTDNCAQHLFDALKASPGHYANMIFSSYTNMGVGIYRGSNGYMFATQEFMTCNAVCPDSTITGYGYHP
jgi:uncharacterized protein YkwD